MNLHGILSFWGKADIAIFLYVMGKRSFGLKMSMGVA